MNFSFRDSIKLTLVASSIFISYEWYIERIQEISEWKSIVLYIALFLACVFVILFLSFIKNNGLRFAGAILLFISSLMVNSYQSVMSEFLTYGGFVTLYESNGFADEAVRQYGRSLVEPVVIALVLFLGMIIPPGPISSSLMSRGLLRQGGLPGKKALKIAFSASPLLVILTLTLVGYSRGGSGLLGLPSGMAAFPYSSLLAFELLSEDLGERERAAQSGQQVVFEPGYDVILLIDESVRGDYLDINSENGVETNLLDQPFVHNFGISAAATNCSAPTNLILRFGGTRAKYRSYVNTKPSLWDFARHAGFKTVYVDGQRTGGRLQNGMDQAEVAHIDEFIQLDDTPVLERDIAIAEMIGKMTRNQRSELIVVNKIGAHFPVHDKYPDDYMRYQPASPRGLFAHVSDTGDREGFGRWSEFLNAYKNTLLWNVGHFFETLIQHADLNQAVVIYTPDHGQNFHEDGSTDLGLHCSSRPSPFEGVVTTVVLTENERWSQTFASWSKANAGKTSHYNIFPTLLMLLGYEKSRINDTYGPTLVEPTDDPMTFNAEFYARLGKQGYWVKVTSDDIKTVSR